MFKKLLLYPPLWIFITIIFSLGISAFSLYNQSIRLDESQSIWVATKSARGILEFMSQDVHPPLYNLLLHFWVIIFGTNVIFSRSLSLLFFLLTLPALFVLAKEAANNRSVAYLTVILFSLSPFVLWFSQETRMYMLFTFIGTLNQIFFLRVFRSETKTSKVGYVLTTIVGLYTHYFFLLLIFTEVLYFLFKKRENLLEIIKFLSLLALAFIAFVPWAFYVYLQGSAKSAQPILPPPNVYNIFQTLTSFLFGFPSGNLQAILISLWPLVLVFFLLIFTNRRKLSVEGFDYFITITFTPIAIAFVVSFLRPIFLPRYLIFVLPTLFFIIAYTLVNFPKKLTGFLAGILLISMAGLLILQNFSATTPVKEDYQGATHYLNQTVTPKDIVAVSAPFTIYPIEFYYTGKARLTTIPEWDRYQSGPTPSFTEELLVNQTNKLKLVYERLFVVLSYDQGYEKRIVNYLDGHFALVGKKNFPPTVQIRIYKLRYLQ